MKKLEVIVSEDNCNTVIRMLRIFCDGRKYILAVLCGEFWENFVYLICSFGGLFAENIFVCEKLIENVHLVIVVKNKEFFVEFFYNRVL